MWGWWAMELGSGRSQRSVRKSCWRSALVAGWGVSAPQRRHRRKATCFQPTRKAAEVAQLGPSSSSTSCSSPTVSSSSDGKPSSSFGNRRVVAGKSGSRSLQTHLYHQSHPRGEPGTPQVTQHNPAANSHSIHSGNPEFSYCGRMKRHSESCHTTLALSAQPLTQGARKFKSIPSLR